VQTPTHDFHTVHWSHRAVRTQSKTTLETTASSGATLILLSDGILARHNGSIDVLKSQTLYSPRPPNMS
jgi:hypothetical protein